VLHIPQLAQDDIAEILSAEVFQKVKDLSEFQNAVPKLGGNLNYIRSLASALCKNRGIEDVVETNDRYFRYMFSSLPNVQQRALYGLALSGETATSADVQNMSGLSAANTASALFRLEKQGVLAKIGDKKRNVTYRINDHLLWLWITYKSL
jgi:Fic family protein